jgi:hypothetical protein
MTVRETLKIGFYPQQIGIPHTSEAIIVLRTQRLGKKHLTPKKTSMKKIILMGVVLISAINARAQWSYEVVDNGFDDPYRIAYTKPNNNAILKLENVEGSVAFYLQGRYFCDPYPTVEMSFLVGSEYKKFYVDGVLSNDSDCIFLLNDINGSNILDAFKSCSIMKLRVNDTECSIEIYTFNMTKSSSAFAYILN